MDDEEMLFKQVQMTAAATKGATVWVYRCSVYAYPWYTSVRTILDDPAYSDWFIKFKPEGPWFSPKCDKNFNPPKCSDNCESLSQSTVQQWVATAAKTPRLAGYSLTLLLPVPVPVHVLGFVCFFLSPRYTFVTQTTCRSRPPASLTVTATAPPRAATVARAPAAFTSGIIPPLR